MRTTASDRKALIRLASSLPVGSPERKTILAGISKTSARGHHPAREVPISTFPRTYALALEMESLWHLKDDEPVNGRLFAKSEAALERASYSKKELDNFAFILSMGFERGQTVEEFKADRGFEDEDIDEMFDGESHTDPPLSRSFPQAAVDAVSSFF